MYGYRFSKTQTFGMVILSTKQSNNMAAAWKKNSFLDNQDSIP
jgi:hypothetical protein